MLFPQNYMNEYVQYQGFMWKKVFYHNFTGRVMFSSESEALHCETTQKFSILDTISPKYKYREKYEFIIWYPSLDYYFQWRQSMNPVLELEKSGKNESEGFELIHKGYDDKDDPFGGLVKTNIKFNNKINSLLNGVPGHSHWYFAIGMYSPSYSPYSTDGIPSAATPTDQVVLWLKDPTIRFQCTQIQIFFLKISRLLFLQSSACFTSF